MCIRDRCTSAAAIATPDSTTHHRCRNAYVMVISCDLSPSSGDEHDSEADENGREYGHDPSTGYPKRAFRRANSGRCRKPLCGKEHREYGRVRVADRIDADPAHHRRDRTVGLCFHPGGTVLETEMGETGQQYLSLIHISEPTRPY